MKKILFLGGSKFQLPPIIYAKENGYYTITCDNIPDNPGHTYSDEYHNISIVDMDAVLDLARSLKVDGIVAYASDVAARTQAYVANRLGLPSNPYESVKILTNKDLFREFMRKHNFLTPKSKGYLNFGDLHSEIENYSLPLMIKPIDASGSKGVTKLHDLSGLKGAFDDAMSFSIDKRVIVEEFFERSNYQIAGDGFVVDGVLVFKSWANEHFDKLCNPLVPIGESFPSVEPIDKQEIAKDEYQRLLRLLNITTGALNFDFQFNKDGSLFILELGPRNGGNLIPEVIAHSTGVDLVSYTVKAALGVDCSDLKQAESKGFYSSYMLHSLDTGIFKEIFYSEEIKQNIVYEKVYVKPGDKVNKFNNSNDTLGTMIMKFDNENEMLEKMDNMEKYLRVIIED